MINLIPPIAKKKIVQEYWLRFAVIMMIFSSIAIGVLLVLQAPSYILLSSQLRAYESQFQAAQLQQADLQTTEKTVKATNALAQHVSTPSLAANFSEVFSALETIASNEIRIVQFSSTRSTSSISDITLRGVATTRTALADFSNKVVEHPLFLEANVPISNLAKDRDIDFEIKVKPAP